MKKAAATTLALALTGLGAMSTSTTGAHADSSVKITNESLIFTAGEKNTFDLELASNQPWKITDHEGAVLRSGSVSSSKASVKMPKLDPGFYELTVGSTQASFLVLGQRPEPTDATYGIGTHASYARPGQAWDAAKVFPLAEAVGFNAVRDDLSWHQFPDHGLSSTPETVSRELSLADQHGLAPLMIADYGHPDYLPDQHMPTTGGNHAPPNDDEGRTAYAKWVKNFLDTNPSVKRIEVWNEFNGGLNRCSPDTSDPCKGGAAYAALVKAVDQQIGDDHPDVEVIAGATAGFHINWWKDFKAAGGHQHADAFSYHPYGSTGVGMDGFRQQMAAEFGTDKPIYLTETGYSVTRDGKRPGNVAQVSSQRAQADRIATTFLHEEGIYWYNLLSLPHGPESVEANFGIFDQPTENVAAYQPRRAAFAFYHLRSLGEFGDHKPLNDQVSISWTEDESVAALHRVDVAKINDTQPSTVTVDVPDKAKTSVVDSMGRTVMPSGKRDQVNVEVGESPLYVKIDQGKAKDDLPQLNHCVVTLNGTPDPKTECAD